MKTPSCLRPAFISLSLILGSFDGTGATSQLPYWAPLLTPSSEDLEDVVKNGDIFVAVGTFGTVLVSPDGSAWSRISTDFPPTDLYAVEWGNGRFVAAGRDGAIVSSADASDWEAEETALEMDVEGLAFDGSQFLAVGANTVASGIPGSAWTIRDLEADVWLLDVTWGNNLFVAVGLDGVAMVSEDGVVWTQHHTGLVDPLEAVAWTGSLFVAFAESDRAAVSVDGIEWTVHECGARGLFGVTWDGNRFLSVGPKGQFAHSGQDPNTALWSGATEAESSWYTSIWFGLFHTSQSFPWIHHETHGWQYSHSEANENGVYVYHAEMDQWTWTNEQAYPWIYLVDHFEATGSWHFADIETEQRGRRFYRLDTQEWLTVSDLRPAGPLSHHFVEIRGGEFQLGDSHNLSQLEWSRPVRDVYVSTFEIAANLVTFAEWKHVHDWAIENGYTFDNPVYNGSTGPTSSSLVTGWNTGKDNNKHPAVNLTWYDAVKWCNARSEMEGLKPAYYTDPMRSSIYRSGIHLITSEHVHWQASGYRLPTEAEWEKAARGGLVGKRYPWGDAPPTPDLGNFWTFERKDGHGTAPVGQFPPNGYGLYDICGNVAQWCWDRLEPTWYADPRAAVVNPRGPEDDGLSQRATRGSSWQVGAPQSYLLMSGYRAGANATSVYVNRGQLLIGIRLVRGPQRGGNR